MKTILSRYGPIIIGVPFVVGALIAFFDPVPDDTSLGVLIINKEVTGETTFSFEIQDGDARKTPLMEPPVLVFLEPEGEGVDTEPELLFICADSVAINMFGEDAMLLGLIASGKAPTPAYFDTKVYEKLFSAYLRENGCDPDSPDSWECDLLYDDSVLLMEKIIGGATGRHTDADADELLSTDFDADTADKFVEGETGIKEDFFTGTTRADPKLVLKAGFDPALLGYCFAVMAFVALWQKRRAFGRDMAICASTFGVGEMVLPAPVIFGWGMSSGSAKKITEKATSLQLVIPVEEELDLEEFEDEEDCPEWREPYREAYYKDFCAIFEVAAGNPALLEHLHQKLRRTNRRDADLVEKAYRRSIEIAV